MEDQTNGQLIFGTNDSEELIDLLFKEELNQKEAKTIIDSVQNRFMKKIIFRIENEIKNKSPKIEVDSDDYNFLEIEEGFIFTDKAFFSGFLGNFHRFLVTAFPDYSFSKPVQPCKISLIRK